MLLLNAEIGIIIQKKDKSRFRMVMMFNGGDCLQYFRALLLPPLQKNLARSCNSVKSFR